MFFIYNSAARNCNPETEFTCSDGTCLPLSAKCNKKYDCPIQNDISDEQNCRKFNKLINLCFIYPPPLSRTYNSLFYIVTCFYMFLQTVSSVLQCFTCSSFLDFFSRYCLDQSCDLYFVLTLFSFYVFFAVYNYCVYKN